MVHLGEHFADKDLGRHSEWLRQQRWFIKARQDSQRRDDIADKAEDGIVSLASEVLMATQSQIRAFETKLDSYDQATVAALMENQDSLDAVADQIEAMLARAYVMEDGRRVFKTEDGHQVFDEHGVEVEADELDPLLIGDDRPSYESFLQLTDQQQALQAERADLLEFQEHLDATREKISEGEISEANLEALDAELLEAMPPTVRGLATGVEPLSPATNLRMEFSKPATIPTAQTQNAEASAPAPAPI